ncbi:hypothetical protein OE88DRAFT_1658744 [Heliocybe sulcata]|uniref:Phosphatidate phosphatase APP1 catalytic domain-containing protein n=1 Tax=Heliocybe sulcata TaxID=5364 RepID=A0A5C3N2P5_9AGAM|nr:hypothetical protein OE88DRAFT_1658744 [Heliocybe sulcata]
MPTRSLLSSALSKLSNARPADLKNTLRARRDLRPGENGYGDEEAKKQSWKQWAGEKWRGRGGEGITTERISLFPGWATRRYREVNAQSYHEFDVEVFVSGFAVSHRPPEYATRAQKAFLRMARGFAALPKLPGQLPADPPALSAAEQDFLRKKPLPPPPSDIPDDYEVQTLEASLRLVAAENEEQQSSGVEEGNLDFEDQSSSTPSSVSSSYASSSSMGPNSPSVPDAGLLPAAVRQMHANLESRLEPFWTTALSGRLVRISVYTSPVNTETLPTPLMTQDVLTGPDGYFQNTVLISWNRVCAYNIHRTLADTSKEHEFFVRTELLLPPPPQASSSAAAYYTSNFAFQSRHLPADLPSSGIHVPLAHAPVRVISDIDDTVKLSSVLSGARAVFHNVFVKELKDVVVPGMPDWYMEMWKRGVRFHYVSNGPFELLPVINDFIQISHLPPGSLKLRSYGGRSLFNGLLSTPAARKRSGVLSVLEAFPESQFLLVGDTGEQDLELYAAIAAERPKQILAIFVRDVSVDENADPVDDPTGQSWKPPAPTTLDRNTTVKPAKGGRMPGLTPLATGRGIPRRVASDMVSPSSATPTSRPTKAHSLNFDQSPLASADEPPDYFSSSSTPSTPLYASSFSNEPEYAASISSDAPSSTPSSRRSSRIWIPGASRQNSMQYAISDTERRRLELQTRIWKARSQIPSSIRLRIFRRPEECVEAFEILGRMQSN